MKDIIKFIGGQNIAQISDTHVNFNYMNFECYMKNIIKKNTYVFHVCRPRISRNANTYSLDEDWGKETTEIGMSISKSREKILRDIQNRIDWTKLEEIRNRYLAQEELFQKSKANHNQLVMKVSELTGLKPNNSTDGISTFFSCMPKNTYGQIYVSFDSVSFEIKGVSDPLFIEKICKVLGEMPK